MIHSELGSYLKSTVMGDTGVDWDTGGVGNSIHDAEHCDGRACVYNGRFTHRVLKLIAYFSNGGWVTLHDSFYELKELSTVWHVCFDIGVSHGIDVGLLAIDSTARTEQVGVCSSSIETLVNE